MAFAAEPTSAMSMFVSSATGKRREPGIGDVYKGAAARAGLRDDEAVKPCKVIGPGIACRYAGRRALMGDEFVSRSVIQHRNGTPSKFDLTA